MSRYISSDIRNRVVRRADCRCEYCLIHKADTSVPLSQKKRLDATPTPEEAEQIQNTIDRKFSEIEGAGCDGQERRSKWQMSRN